MINRISSVKKIVDIILVIAVLVQWNAVASALPTSKDHPFGKAAVMDRVILSVIENYYDPQRIDSTEMFKATMDTLPRIREILSNVDPGLYGTQEEAK